MVEVMGIGMKKRGWILTNPDWGYCAIPDYPALWLEERDKAHVFSSRHAAIQAARQWAKGLVKVEAV
jgi:hypothetical protein